MVTPGEEKSVVLVVDDESGICEQVKSYFTAEGYTVVTAQSVEDGIKASHDYEGKPMSAFVDYDLIGGKTGMDFLVHARDFAPHVASWLLTAKDNWSIRNEARWAGAQETIIKHKYYLDELLMCAKITPRLIKEKAIEPVTGLLRRDVFFQFVGSQLQRIARRGKPETCAVLMVDIDEFKSINDLHGHSAGDRALRDIATAIIENTRQGDLSGKYGGDEDVVWLPGADERIAEHRAELIEAAIRLIQFFNDKGKPVHLSATVGFGSMHHLEISRFPDPLVELVRRADARLYELKDSKKGRGRG